MLVFVCAFVFGINIIPAQTREDVTIPDTIAIQEAIHEIKNFYVTYTTNMLSVDSSNDSIRKKYLTKNLIAKVYRMGASTGIDPITRTQDFREDVVKTFSAKHLEKNWYMVSFIWDTDTMNIPVRINKIGGRYMIDYITPQWNGNLYGDSLLFDNTVQQVIDASSPLSLLKSFYAAYTMEYCSITEELMSRLAMLREKYLTPNALTQFEAAATHMRLDGLIGYDLLIDDFDFDRLWLPSMTYTQLNEDTYQIAYTKWEAPCIIILKVNKQGKEYRINDIKYKYIIPSKKE